MPSLCSACEILQVFIESVDELLKSRYFEQATTGGIGSSIACLKGIGTVMSRSGPDRDSVKAALLTIRLFCQNNERTSLHNMDALVATLPVSQTLKDEFSQSRAEFNAHLSSAPTIQYPDGIGADTNGDVFYAYLYGVFAHANPDKRRLVRSWESQLYSNDLLSQFDLTLLNFISALTAMKGTIENIMSKLQP